MESVPWDSDDLYTLPECEFTPLENRKFIGWSVNRETQQPGDTLILYENTTVTALWKAVNYVTVTFNAGTGGSGTMDSVTWDAEETYTLPECGFTAPENQKFIGWSVNNEIKQPCERITLTGNTTLTAQWRNIKDITVTFDAGEGGTGEMPSEPWDSDELYTLPECTFAVPTGKMFFGWKVGSDEVVKLPGNPVSLKTDTVLTAVWLDTEGTAVAQDTVSMTGVLYTVDGDVTVTGRIQVSGVVTLDLRSGKLTASKGIHVPEGAVLNIISSTGNGSLYADGANAEGNCAGIGADTIDTGVGTSDGDNAGTINIYGGNIEAIGGYEAAAIGGGYVKNGGSVSILGGTVNAVSGGQGCGIGSGSYATGGNVTISGGTVTVTAGSSGGFEGTGIGAGYFGNINNIIINGGNITATAYSLPGIGCGNKADCISIGGNCIIDAKSLSNDGYNDSAAIGCGYQTSCEKIEITGGDITASTGAHGYSAIGTGKRSALKELNISGGIIHATGGENGFGIGIHIEGSISSFQEFYPECSITITGGIITASGGKGGIIESFVGSAGDNKNVNCTVTKAKGLISEDDGETYTVYGDYTLSEDFEVGAGKSLTVSAGATLNIPEGITFKNDGIVYNDGMILLNGTFTNNDNVLVKLTLNTNGGEIVTASLSTVYCTYTEPLGNLGVTRTGYNLLGWFDAEMGGNQVETVPLNPVTLYARWEINQYTITYNVNGEFYAGQTYDYGAAVTAPDYTAPEGYTFSGWEIPETMPAENLVLDATLILNTYTVTLYMNDGSNEIFDTVSSVKHGSKLIVEGEPIHSHYDFTGWFKNAEMTEKWDFDTDTVTADTALYAGWEEHKAYWAFSNMKIGDEVNIGYVLHIDESLQTLPDLRLVFNPQGETPHEIEIPFASAKPRDYNGKTYYAFYCPAPVKEMTVKTTAKLISGSGENIVVHVDNMTRSVRDYCETALSSDFSPNTKALIKSMLNYGTAAQQYFNYNTDDLANSILDEADKTVPEHNFSGNDTVIEGELPEDLVHNGCTLMFVSKIRIRFYFTGNIEGVTFSIGEKEYAPQPKNGMYFIETDPISALDLNNPVTLTVTKDGKTWTKTYSVWVYAAHMQENENSALVKAMEAMYDYCQKAIAYRDNPNN